MYLKGEGRVGEAAPESARPRVHIGPLQEWMGYRYFKTTVIDADYQPAAEQAAVVEKAFSGANSASAQPVGRSSRR
jgi:hypothetical protein